MVVPDRRIAVPLPTALPRALDEHPVLKHLREQIRASNACLESVRDLLPPPLQTAVRAGPIEGERWTLLVGNAAVAAKLRQLGPRLEKRLIERGMQISAIRIRVQRSQDAAL